MDNKFFEVNKNIELEILEGSYQGNYKSKVSEINKNNIKILTPFIKGELVPLRKSVNLKVFFTGNTAAFSFGSQVLDREKKPIPVIVIEQPEEVKRIQRRDYFRLEIQVDVKYRLVDEEGEPLEDDFKRTGAIDVSAGGIKMVVDDILDENTFLELYLNIPEIEDVPILGKVVQNYKTKDGQEVGIEFTVINTNLRDKIVGWLFDKQRELRKKGLL